MLHFSTIDDVLDYAIEQEEQAELFYRSLAKLAQNPAMRDHLEQMAQEEHGHQAKLKAFKSGEQSISFAEKVEDLKVADYLVDIEPKPDMSYEEALILSMKKEKAAFKFYSDLAQIAGTDELRMIFQALAQEEAKHKLRFEIEYDDMLGSSY